MRHPGIASTRRFRPSDAAIQEHLQLRFQDILFTCRPFRIVLEDIGEPLSFYTSDGNITFPLPRVFLCCCRLEQASPPPGLDRVGYLYAFLIYPVVMTGSQ